MTTRKALIVGNNNNFNQELSSFLISNFKNEINIIGSINSVKKAIELINEYNPEILFIDICLVDGSAFDILSVTNHNSKAILFLNEKDESLEKILKSFSARYLFKPFDVESYSNIIENVINDNEISEPIKLKKLIANFKFECLNNKIILTDNKAYRLIEIAKIIRFEVRDNYITIYMSDSSNFKFVSTLIHIEQILSQSDSTFIRVHNNQLINMSYVNSCSKKDHSMIILTDGTNVDVSYRRKNALLTFLKNQRYFIKSISLVFQSALVFSIQ